MNQLEEWKKQLHKLETEPIIPYPTNTGTKATPEEARQFRIKVVKGLIQDLESKK